MPMVKIVPYNTLFYQIAVSFENVNVYFMKTAKIPVYGNSALSDWAKTRLDNKAYRISSMLLNHRRRNM